jgi:hypothetical protein
VLRGLIAFPDALPSHEVMDRDAARIGCWAAEPSPGLDEHLRGLGFEPGWRPHWMTAAAAAAEPDPRVSEPPEVPEYDDHGQALVDSASSRAAALGIDTLTLNAENAEFWAAAGFRSLGHGQTWWHRRS